MTAQEHGVANEGVEGEKAVLERHENFAQRLAELREQATALLAELERRTEPQVPEEQGTAARSVAPPATGSPVVAGASNTAADTTYLDSGAPNGALYVTGDARGVSGVARNGPGLHGLSYRDNGVFGYAAPTSSGAGVRGESTAGHGVYGYTDSGVGTLGVGVRGMGVLAFSQGREALNAYSVEGSGVVAGTNSGSAAAVLAENSSGSPGGVAVVALGQSGTGLYASGGQAAIQLGRSALTGPPTSGFHVAGELVLDAGADLYLCKVTGSPGTWKLVA